MITIVLAGRNDNYGGSFRERLFRAALHNSALLADARIDFEYLLAEWNPLEDRALLAQDFVSRLPNARAIVIPNKIHETYSLNGHMPFHEMAAKNAALRRAGGDYVIVTNADILFSEKLVSEIARKSLRRDTLYRAHRIDVKEDLPYSEMSHASHQLPSGEGKRAPCYYLGAGGDFCLAARTLWHRLRGFNEHIRFSTRGKDWQLFLSAAAEGMRIEFLGDVYHLDHEGGFRNTASEHRNSKTAHFGGPWDIEFGLPVRNAPDWGFRKLEAQPLPEEPRIGVLDALQYSLSPSSIHRDHQIQTWLSGPSGSEDAVSAILLHTICAAHLRTRRIMSRMKDEVSLVSLTGLAAVAAEFQVPLFCDWEWPSLPGLTPRRFQPIPGDLRDEDWVLEEEAGSLTLKEYGNLQSVNPLPQELKIGPPSFNPLLARRLLRAYLRIQALPSRRVAIYGAGSHTAQLMRWGVPDTIEVRCIVESSPRSKSWFGLPVSSLDALDPSTIDVLLLSSIPHEPEMAELAAAAGFSNVIPLYGDWPADMGRADLAREQ